MSEKEFDKYKVRGNANWREMMSRDPRVFNAFQQARYEWIMRLAGNLEGQKVLDLGCGGGSLVYLLAKAGANVTGVDNEALGLEYARANLDSVSESDLKYEFKQGSAYELPFEEGVFDIVTNCEVIEHLSEPERMLAEIKRVLRPGGRLILTTPYRFTELPRDPNHVKEYFPLELKSLLETSFVEVGVMTTHHMLWRALYAYPVRLANNRPLGRWLINVLALWFGRNPFLVSYDKPSKTDAFSSICAWGAK